MSRMTFATANISQRINMIEEALEKVLDRSEALSVESFADGHPMHLWVNARPWSDERTGFCLHQIARELEALLP